MLKKKFTSYNETKTHDLDAVVKDAKLGKARTMVRQTGGGGHLRGTYSEAGEATSTASLWSPPQLGFAKFTSELFDRFKWEQSDTSAT